MAISSLTGNRDQTASISEPYRALIEQGLGRGRNAMAIWQDMVSDHGFPGGYETVKRFVRKLRGSELPEAVGIILTASGEDYGEFRVMVRNGGEPVFCRRISAAADPLVP